VLSIGDAARKRNERSHLRKAAAASRGADDVAMEALDGDDDEEDDEDWVDVDSADEAEHTTPSTTPSTLQAQAMDTDSSRSLDGAAPLAKLARLQDSSRMQVDVSKKKAVPAVPSKTDETEVGLSEMERRLPGNQRVGRQRKKLSKQMKKRKRKDGFPHSICFHFFFI